MKTYRVETIDFTWPQLADLALQGYITLAQAYALWREQITDYSRQFLQEQGVVDAEGRAVLLDRSISARFEEVTAFGDAQRVYIRTHQTPQRQERRL